jgi:hypothetical protein
LLAAYCVLASASEDIFCIGEGDYSNEMKRFSMMGALLVAQETAEATDAVGNTSGPSSTRKVIVDTTAPAIWKVVPVEPATGISSETNVSAFFSEAMKASSATSALKLYKKGSTTALEAKVTYDATAKKAVLDPSINLKRGATYKAVVTSEAKDLSGNALDQFPSVAGNQQKVWYFTIKP